MTHERTYLLAGGGTGGHLFPGVALARALQRKQPGVRTIFVGSGREIERRILQQEGLPHIALPLTSWTESRRRPDRFLWSQCRSWWAARQLVRQTRPAAVIGLGGYLSMPTIWAAACERVPILLLEQNAIPGRATSWLARMAQVVCVSFEESLAGLPHTTPTLLSGTPLRDEVRVLADEPTDRSPSGPPTLLVLGGSQGAEGLNAAVLSLLRDHAAALRDWRVIHQTGSRQQDDIRQQYAQAGQHAEVADFLTDVAGAYRRADLVISRAGATTISELTCAGRPMVLVPYPHATDQHQHANAAALVRHHAAVCVEQSSQAEESAARLAAAVLPLLDDTSRRQQLALAARSQSHPDATDRVCELLTCCLRSAA